MPDGCPIQSADGLSLYLASNRPRSAGALPADLDIWVAHRESKRDIFVSREGPDGRFGPAVPVTELNSTAADVQPNVRHDGREVVFASMRKPGVGQDLWSATRERVGDPWSEPVNLAEVNTPVNETRPSLSWDGETLYFGRGPIVGPADIHVSTRDRAHGHEDAPD